MHKVLLIGNPNVGKSTLFNSLTKSHEHTGNFHGVTVEEKRKRITFEGEQYEFVDLPGLYSLNTFSFEEEVSKNIILKGQSSTKILLADANSLKRNLYLALQMSELNLNYKILINNYDYFLRHGGKIDTEKLQQKLGVKIEIINAKKIKLSKEILNTYVADSTSQVDNSTIQKINYVDNSTQRVANSTKMLENGQAEILQNFENARNKNSQKNFENQKNKGKNTKNLQNLSENSKFFKNFSKNNNFFESNENKNLNNNLKNNFNSFFENVNLNKNNITKNFSYLKNFIDIVKSKYNLTNEQIIFAFNGEFKYLTADQIEFIRSLYPQIIEARYKFLDDILSDCMSVKKDFVYGESKADKMLLNPLFMFAGFLLFFFAGIYVIFFGVGPLISDCLIAVFNAIIAKPIMNLLYLTTSNVWLIEFFSGGVFNSFTTVLAFLPQVCLLFVFLCILEDSGIISRMAYVFDDFLNKFGLNGKAIYIILMGLGCNTMSTLASRNTSNKNLKIKTALVNPYISCMARLPVFVIVASAFFGKLTYFVIVGLYLLGLIVALIMAYILNKTILKNTDNSLLLEFPPIRALDLKHIYQVGKTNAVDFTKRVFGVVLSVGVIVWILSHTTFSFAYTQIMTDSILFFFAEKIAFLFAPIGLNSAGIVCALIVGIMAKELIVSTLSISNNVSSTSALIASLTLASSVVNFSRASAVSFLIFSLLYCPCISNLAVLKKEVGTYYMWFAIVSQLTTAYLLSFVAYQGMTHGIILPIIAIAVAVIILISAIYIIKKVKHPKCLTCNKCKRG